MILVQNIVLDWYKDCRGGMGAVQRSQFPQAAKLPDNFFEYSSYGSPVHWRRVTQKKDGFHIRYDYRRMEQFDSRVSLHLRPMQLICKEDSSCEIRYRYDLHQGAKPERCKYSRERNGPVPLNEPAFELHPGDYGRAVCNGRFVDWDTGEWWYEWNITNIIVQAEKEASLDCFLAKEPTHYYQQIAQLW